MSAVGGWLRKFAKRASEPTVIRRWNGIAVVVWIVLGLPTLLFWRESVLWVAILSLWANIVTHYGAWLTARVEVRSKHIEDGGSSGCEKEE